MSDIDDIFKNNLNEKGIAYMDSYWEEMETLLDKKKKKRGLFKLAFLSLAIIGLISIGAFYLINNKVQNKPVLVQQGVVSKFPDNTVKPNNKDASNSNNRTDKGISSRLLQEDRNHVLNKRSENSYKSKTDKRLYILKGTTDGIENRNIKEEETYQTINNNFTLPEDAINQGFLRLNMLKTRNIVWGFPSIDNLPLIKPIASEPSKNKVTLDSIANSPKWQFYIASSYEFDYYSRKANTETLKVDEKTLNTSGYNISFLAKKGKWGLRSGLGFLQLSELSNYITINKTYSYDTGYQMVNPNYGFTASGTRIAIIKRVVDTNVISNNAILNPNSKVNFRYLKIPLLATYGMTLGRFGFSLEAGINTSFLIGAQGNYTTYENNRFAVKSVKESKDISKLLFQTTAGFNLKYGLGKSFNIFCGYGISRAMNSMVKSYNQKPKINLFNFGLEYTL